MPPLQDIPSRRRTVHPVWTPVLALLLGGCAGEPETISEAPRTPAVQEIVVGGLDYTFEMAESVSAGPAEIVFENRGEVDHELVLVRLQPGATMEQVTAAMAAREDPRDMMDGIGGILIAAPGETAFGRLQVEFEAGRTYVLLCNFTDTPEAPPHLALGMIRGFIVEAAEA
jgi:uncharacterized cupredoxin-like copper-binding protein